MSMENYESVLVDLQTRRDQIDAAIEAIRLIMGAGAEMSNGTGASMQRAIAPQNVPAGAFHRMSLVDATKKYLDLVKTKQSTNQILMALEQGGLPPTKYTTLYAVLKRRQSQVQDIVKLGDDWALSEWHPNNPTVKKLLEGGGGALKKKKRRKVKKAKKASPVTSVAAASTEPTQSAKAAEQGPTIADLAERILKESGNPMSATTMLPKMAELGRTPLRQNLANALRKDAKKRFKESHGNFELVS